MADRSNARLNEEIESKIRQWDGTIFGASLKNMYENGTSYEGMSCILELLSMMNAETTSTLSSLPEMITRMSADLIMSEKYGSSSMGGKKS